jgi:hypothetical protein
MRKPMLFAALCGAALLAVPVTAAIRALTLGEMLTITHDTVLVRITAKSTFAVPYPFQDAVWTRLTVEGESLRTGKPFADQVVFLGSHEPADQFGTSEMPALQDTRVGSQALVFWETDAAFPGGATKVAHNLAYVYRVEDGFGTPVVIGKGEGAAFPDNLKLADARAQVLAAQQSLPAVPAGN